MTKLSVLGSALFILLSLSIGIQNSSAQKIVSGDLKFLKGQESINIVFDYTDFKIEKETEQELVNRVVSEKNTKEAGTGDKFKEDWEADKVKNIEAFKRVLTEKFGVKIDENAKYTLVVSNINLVNKGWGNKISGGNPAQMKVDFNFVETGKKDVSLCKLHEGRASYMANTGTLSQKIQGCIEYSAHQIGKSINKNN